MLGAWSPAQRSHMWSPDAVARRYGHLREGWQLAVGQDSSLAAALEMVRASSAPEEETLQLFHMKPPTESVLLTGVLNDIDQGPPSVSHIIRGGGAAVFSAQSKGGGFTLHSHGEAWFAQVAGRKVKTL